jgi:hypothetical protein
MPLVLTDQDWREVDKHLDMFLTANKAGEVQLHDVRGHLSELIAVSVNHDGSTFKYVVGQTLSELFGGEAELIDHRKPL